MHKNFGKIEKKFGKIFLEKNLTMGVIYGIIRRDLKVRAPVKSALQSGKEKYHLNQEVVSTPHKSNV